MILLPTVWKTFALEAGNYVEFLDSKTFSYTCLAKMAKMEIIWDEATGLGADLATTPAVRLATCSTWMTAWVAM